MAPSKGQSHEIFNFKDQIGTQVWQRDEKGVVKEVSLAALDGKYVGIYLWRPDSPPCNEFTEHLTKVYQKLWKEGHAFEVAFLVSDKRMFDAFVADGGMPWMAVVCSGPKRSALTKKFGIKTVPALMMVSPERKVVAGNARTAILDRPAEFPWEGAVDEEADSNDANSTYAAIAVICVTLLSILFGYWYFYNMGDGPAGVATGSVNETLLPGTGAAAGSDGEL